MQFLAVVGGTNINLASMVLKLFFHYASFSNDLEGIDSQTRLILELKFRDNL